MLVVAHNLDLMTAVDLKLKLDIVGIVQFSTLSMHRLLHYHHNADDTAYKSWCGWHNDHGAITVLTPSMLLDYND